MGHALVPVGGKIWEFVGPLEQGNADFIPWKVRGALEPPSSSNFSSSSFNRKFFA